MNGRNWMLALLTFLMVWSPVAHADPVRHGAADLARCSGSPITRIGVQKTYVFYKNGIETFVIRPGFEGKVDEFGMLIPFPSPPAIRKVADDVFEPRGSGDRSARGGDRPEDQAVRWPALDEAFFAGQEDRGA